MSTQKKIFQSADSEDEFLTEMLQGQIKWKARALTVKATGSNPEKELQYAEAYRLLLNKFSEIQSES